MKGLGTGVLLLLLCSAKCWAMSRSEIDDFSNYLRKTSVLDQNLKDGFHSDHEADEVAEDVSDDAWEKSGKFEGDLILNDRQRRLIVEHVTEGLSRNGLKDSTKRWPDNEVIYYIQKEHFSGDQLQAIQDGIDDLARASCIKFKPYRKGDRDAVVIQGSRRGCFSQVGYQGGYQVLNLSARHPVGRGCFRHGTVVHEMLHTLGFFHMQSSPDRDDYIDVVWENIVEPFRHNFKKYNTFSVSDFGVGYDYESVLHYGRRAFSNNGRDTLVPKKDGVTIGQRIGLSDKDTQKLNKMYCDDDSNNFDDEDAHKPFILKKKPTANSPFQGHGIGYHQGKAHVIKLPAAATFVIPDKPIHEHMYYFSKTPKAVSTTEAIQGFRAGKKVKEFPKIDDDSSEYDAFIKYDTPILKDNSKVIKTTPTSNQKDETRPTSAEDNSSKSVSDYESENSSEFDTTKHFKDIDKILADAGETSQESLYDFYNHRNNYETLAKSRKGIYSPKSHEKSDSEEDSPKHVPEGNIRTKDVYKFPEIYDFSKGLPKEYDDEYEKYYHIDASHEDPSNTSNNDSSNSLIDNQSREKYYNTKSKEELNSRQSDETEENHSAENKAPLSGEVNKYDKIEDFTLTTERVINTPVVHRQLHYELAHLKPVNEFEMPESDVKNLFENIHSQKLDVVKPESETKREKPEVIKPVKEIHDEENHDVESSEYSKPGHLLQPFSIKDDLYKSKPHSFKDEYVNDHYNNNLPKYSLRELIDKDFVKIKPNLTDVITDFKRKDLEFGILKQLKKQHNDIKEPATTEKAVKIVGPEKIKGNVPNVLKPSKILTLRYTSEEKSGIDAALPFSTVQPVQYEFVNFLPYNSDIPDTRHYDTHNYINSDKDYPKSYLSDFSRDFPKYY